MRAKSWIGFGIAALTVVGCGQAGDVAGGSAALRPPSCEPLTGAIFTTNSNGSRVNENIYGSKEDVYLDGGPGNNAPASAAGLPEGDYYFQVTDPSGKTLLSTDAVVCREFHVSSEGLIDAVPAIGCAHRTGIDEDHGALTVQLMPFSNTPNPGGEYKVWVTRTSDFVGNPALVDNPEYVHGFVHSCSKTDNFKVRQPSSITACKFRDNDKNGYTCGDAPIPYWPITITGPDDFSELVYTGEDGCVTVDDLAPGDYTVTETLLEGWHNTMPLSESVHLGEGDSEVVFFANYCFLHKDACPPEPCPGPPPPCETPTIEPVY